MLTSPWRRFLRVALWNGQAAQVTIGTARATQSHSQPGKRHSGTRASTIVRSMSGTVSTAARMSRLRSEVMRTSVARFDQASSASSWMRAP